jgi:uncharacterized protein YegP (UPF0339 family)/outer membrane protein OmpA-like peptidoglycan-associated protein
MKIQIFDKPGADDQFSFQFLTNEGHAVAVSQHTYPNRDACVAAVEKTIALSADTTNYVNFNEAGEYFFAVLNANGETLLSSVAHSSYQDCEDTEDYLQSECEGENDYEVTFTNFERTEVPVMTKQAISIEEQYDMAAWSSRTGAVGVDVFEDATKGSFYFLLRDASGTPFLYSRAYTRKKLRDGGLYHALTSNNFEAVENEAAFYFIVRNEAKQEVARSRNYESKDACELAIANAKSLAQVAPDAYKIAPEPRAASKRDGTNTSTSNQYTFNLPVSDGEGLETLSEKGKYFFVCKDDSGRPFLFSQAYSAASSRDNGVRSLIKNAGTADRYETKEEDGTYYFIIRAGNRQEIARSRHFNTLAALNEYIALLQSTVTKEASKYALATEQKIVTSSETFSLKTKGIAAPPVVAAALVATSETVAEAHAIGETNEVITNTAESSAISNTIGDGAFVAGSSASGVIASGIDELVSTTGSEAIIAPVAVAHPVSAVSNMVSGEVFVAGSNASGVTASGIDGLVVTTGKEEVIAAIAPVVAPVVAPIVVAVTQVAEAAPVVVAHSVSAVSNMVSGEVFVAGSNASGVTASGIDGLVVTTGKEEVIAALAPVVAPVVAPIIVAATQVVEAYPVSAVSNMVSGGVFVAGSNASGVTASGIDGLVVHKSEPEVAVETVVAPVVAAVVAAPIVATIVEKTAIATPAVAIDEIIEPVTTIIGIDVPEVVKVEKAAATAPVVEILAATALAAGTVISTVTTTTQKEVIVADEALSAALTDATVTSDVVAKQLAPITIELPKTAVEETITVALEKSTPAPIIVEKIVKTEEVIKVVTTPKVAETIVEKIIETPKKPDVKVVKVDLTEKKPEIKVVKIEKKEIVVERKPEIKVEKIEKKEIIIEKKPEIKVEKKEIVVEKKIEKKEITVEKKIEAKPIVVEKKVEKIVEKAAAPVVVEEAGVADGCMRWLPWLLGALALMGLLAWLMRGCNDPKPPVPTTPSITAPIAPTPIKPVVMDTVKTEKVAPVEKAAAPTTFKSFFANGTGTQTFVMDDVCFPKNTHKMSGASIAQVPRIVKMLKANPTAKLTIHGYSEAGEKADLWMCSDGQKRDLAATRARCLYQRLINAGAKASQLEFVGHLDQASPINKTCPYRGLDLEVTK